MSARNQPFVPAWLARRRRPLATAADIANLQGVVANLQQLVQAGMFQRIGDIPAGEINRRLESALPAALKPEA